MSVVVAALDKTAPLEVMTALLEHSKDITPENSLVCIGDVIDVDAQQGHLR
jgi:hypothetical protein